MIDHLGLEDADDRAAITILGIGNDLLSDEGIGIHALHYLQQQRDRYPVLASARLVDGGTLSFTLADTIAASETLIVIDAAALGRHAGAVACFHDAALDDYLANGPRRSVHEVGLIDLLAIAQLTDTLPPRRALIGVQPALLDWGTTPTAAVAAALPQVAEQVVALLERWPA